MKGNFQCPEIIVKIIYIDIQFGKDVIYLYLHKGSQIKSSNDLGIVIRCTYSQEMNSTAKCVL